LKSCCWYKLSDQYCYFSANCDWIELPEPGTKNSNIVEDLRFQIKTKALIGVEQDVNKMFLMFVGTLPVVFNGETLTALHCIGYNVPESAGFRTDADGGIFTFLKNSTHLKIWYDSDTDGEGSDDLLEVEWEFEDDGEACNMKRTAKGLQFYKLAIAVGYRYDDQGVECTALDSTWTAQQMTTSASFPVHMCTVIKVSCPADYSHGGDDTVICTEGTDFSFDGTVPSCGKSE